MRPFYSVYFNSRMCHMKITVNGIPLLNMEVNGQCSSRYPFNNLLLESGWATIRYEARPLKGETKLREEAFLSCKVELYDLDSNNDPLSTMASYEKQNDTIIPYMLHDETFKVDVPYNLIGWKQSTQLDQFKNHQLRPQVIRKYNSIISMMRNHDFSQYENAFKEREDIIGACYYLSEYEKQDRMNAVKEAIMNCDEIVPLSGIEMLEFAADSRLVRLVKTDHESALRLRSYESREETTIDLWLHMKHGTHELSII